MRLATVFVAAFLVAATAVPACAASAPVPGADSVLAARGVKKGYLFSAVSFGDSALGRTWGELREEAAAKFPGLKLAQVADLHITVVYIGGDWKVADLAAIRPLAATLPAGAARMTPEVVRMGRNNQVVAVEMHGAPAAWVDSVIAAKNRLNALGLKKPDAYDTSFRTHVTLAEARHNPPDDAEAAALGEFMAWIAAKVAAAPAAFSAGVGPATRVELLLAGATRPADAPEYQTVEAFLERALAGGAAH